MNKLTHNKRIQQRVLYTLCFFVLCLIDWMKVSLNGRTQMIATNMTGLVIALIILSALKLKGFYKPVYAVWLLLCVLVIPIGIHFTLSVYPYKGQVITAALNIIIYGLILIRIVTDLITTRSCDGLRVPVFAIWIVMLLLMFFSINENIWPIWYAVMFGSFYLTEFDKDTERNILLSIPDGIILGFIIIQGMALLFRPYDVVRYSGLYVNPNFNALFYLMSYSAFLCKWFLLKLEGKNHIVKMVLYLSATSMYGFCIFTGSKTVILAMLVVTVIFLLPFLKQCKNKALSFLKFWLILGLTGLISVPITYCAIRYMPTIHLHPLYFEGEYNIDKVQPGEQRDSVKYITFEQAMEDNVGRVFYILPKLEEYIDSFFTIKIYAAEPEAFQEPEYIIPNEEVYDGIDPIRLRQEIYRYYIERLNLIGHTNDYEEAPICFYYSAPHAHNVFIQMAFLYGIPAGVLFVLMVLIFVPRSISLIKAGEVYRACLISCFIIAFVTFGFFEIDWMCGQLSFTMLFLLFRDVVRKDLYLLNL